MESLKVSFHGILGRPLHRRIIGNIEGCFGLVLVDVFKVLEKKYYIMNGVCIYIYIRRYRDNCLVIGICCDQLENVGGLRYTNDIMKSGKERIGFVCK